MPVDKKKLNALVQQNAKKQPKTGKGGGGGKKFGGQPGGDDHDKEDADHDGEPHDKEKHGHEDKSDDDVAHEQAERVAAGDGEDDLMHKADDIDDPSSPPDWVHDEDIWDRAKSACDNLAEEPENYNAVLAHTYKALGGEVGGDDDDDGSDD